MKASTIASILIAAAFVLTACSVKSKEDSATSRDEPEESPANTTWVTLTQKQIATVGIQLGSLEQKPIDSTLRVNGVLEVPNQYKALVTSLYAGTVRTLNVHPGSVVRKGQAIATIVNPELVNLQQQYLTVNTQIGLAGLEYERQKMLVAGNAGARKNLQQAETVLSTLQTQRTALQKQLSTLGISAASVASGNITSTLAVPAPISGTVSRVEARIGTYVDASTDIAEIVNNALLQVKLFVYEKDLSVIQKGQTIRFTTTNNPGREYEALINSIGSAFEGGTATIAVRAAVKGDKTGLIDSMNITAVLSMGNVTMPALPNDAFVNYGGQDYIFIQVDRAQQADAAAGKATMDEKDEKHVADEAHDDGIAFKRISVMKGPTSLGYTGVKLLQEIPAGAKVIVKGAFFALAKMTNAGEEE